ncbi:hypothetical protein QQZ08_004192 [Neonectria magnoliae]|uniref:Protein kinase domain-containing protein n=1 Tax=Neonectria magnoliae TaxID=2732573 RepID=A0ABR1I8M4_9HYPO
MYKNIIEYLGHEDFHTNTPLISMPLRDGNLVSLADLVGPGEHDELCGLVAEQILKALDYLAFYGMCHRGVKPDNILYTNLGQKEFLFQLADFGMASLSQMAVTSCGTNWYQAPELYQNYGKAPQTPKMDVWSLAATILATHHSFPFPPFHARAYHEVFEAVQTCVAGIPFLKRMAAEDPERRASAAQMLIAPFQDIGLTTPRGHVPPLML